jgi:hypothetical protein
MSSESSTKISFHDLIQKLGITDQEYNILADRKKMTLLRELVYSSKPLQVSVLQHWVPIHHAFERRGLYYSFEGTENLRQLLHYHLMYLVNKGYLGKTNHSFFAKEKGIELIKKATQMKEAMGYEYNQYFY